MADDNNTEALINRNTNQQNKFSRCVSHAQDELHSFRSFLRWLCVDQSNLWTSILSWSIFVLFAILVPAISHFMLACETCDSKHKRPYNGVVQLSLSCVSTLSFLCLSNFVRKYGLRRFLFFDKLWHDSETVRMGYTKQLNRSLKILSIFVFPCLAAECAYKIWWYASGASQIPFLGNVVLSDAIACIMEIFSWLYRTTVIFLVCVLFRLICYLQILRLHDFATVFQVDSDVGSVLSEHFRIRKHLMIISHRFRAFILWFLILVTGSQFASLLMITKPNAKTDFYKTGELALCSMTLLTGLLILLRSATKITHKAQSVTCLATKWHVCATLDSFEANNIDIETPTAQAANNASQMFLDHSETDEADDENEDGDDEDEDELDNTKLIPDYAHSTISFQKRQALVTYLDNNRAGVTVFGITLDRTTLHSIFGIEMGLVLWILGKTIGIS